jgi:phage tail-like protein
MPMMSMNNLLPVIPQPPDDPRSWLLDALAGWHAATLVNVEQAPTSQALALSPIAGSGRSLTEPGGSFAGLVLPANVALGPGGDVYLLDSKTLELKRFDPCECLFKIVPCFGGRGQGRRQLLTPHGIGICSGNLYVCDTGNHRLSVYSLRGFVWRAAWRPPTSANLANAWEPYAVAFDGQGRVFVTDGANGCIHRFSPSGRWEACLPGFGKVTYIAIDCQDRLYVVVEGVENSVQVVDTNGKHLDTVSRPDEIASRFPRLPFQVDAQGNIYLSEFCSAAGQQNKAAKGDPPRGVFDLYGNPVTSVVAQAGPVYNTTGLYISEGLDSKLYQCQWHRVILQAQVPRGCRASVSTYTTEVLQPADYISGLPDEAWETNQTLFQADSGMWDCLIRSNGGRYLWLRLQFRSNGSATPSVESIVIEFPRISLRRYLPAVFGEDPSGAQFTDRFLSIFDTTLRSIEKEIDTEARYFDPLATPAVPDPKTGVDFLSWLASWIGVVFDRQWPEAKRRQFLKRVARLYHIRGTREGLWRQLLFYLGMEPETICCANDQPRTACRPEPSNCEPVVKLPCAWQPPPLILEHYQLRRWLFLGQGRLGDQAVLWGKRIVDRSQLNAGAQVSQTQLITTQDPYRDPFHVYAHKFSVFVPACYGRSDRHRKALENLLKAEQPAHTLALLVFVEPRFRIGFQSMIGLDSVIGRYPEGVTLNATPLGQASVLGEPPDKQGKPTLQIGKQSRLGTTTKLD